MSGRVGPITLLTVVSQASVAMCSWGLGVILPELSKAYALSATGVGAVVAAGSVGTALALVPAGALVDAIGTRLPLVLGAVLTAASLTWAGRAGSTGVLIAAFALFGACSALVVSAGSVALFDAAPPQRRGLAMGLRQMSISLGGLLSALTLPSLIQQRGLAFALAATGLLTVVSSSALALLISPRTRARRRVSLDLPGLLAIPGMRRLVTLACVMSIALSTALSFSVQALRAEGATVAQGTRLFVVMSLAAMLSRIVWGRLADPRHHAGALRRWQTLRRIGACTALGGVVYALAAHQGVHAQIAAMALFSFGVLGANGVIHLTGGELAGSQRAGAAMGLTSMVMFGVSGLAAPFLGAIADHVGYDVLWWLAAAMGLCTALLANPALANPTTAPPTSHSA